MNIGKKDSCYALSVVDKFVKKRRRAEEKQFENLYSPLKCNYDTMDEDDNNGMAAVLSAYGAVITTASRRHGRSRRSAIDREQQKVTCTLDIVHLSTTFLQHMIIHNHKSCVFANEM